MRRTVVGIVAAVLIVGVPQAAHAADGDNVPAAANPTWWSKYVDMVKRENAAQDWSTPTGIKIADSGFRPFSNGFSFMNTAVPDVLNSKIFGSPRSGPVNLDADTLRNMMGPEVCLERQPTGPCTLTIAGKLWRDSVNAAMDGGHCYGFAAAAALLFNGRLQPGQFQPGAASAYDLRLADPVNRTIARYMSQQYVQSPTRFNAKPSKIVEQLRTQLAPGSLPPVLTIFSPEGGHAVTPYALYQGENGRYDIAIYDNNYPDFQRVVRVDTVKEKASYAFQVNPSAPPANSTLNKIGLVPTDFIAEEQPCPFCRDSKHTTIQIEPVVSQVPLRTKVTTLNGKPVPKLKKIMPTNPWEPGQRWNFPTYQLPKGKSFILRINAKKSARDIRPTIVATTGAYSLGANRARIPARTVGKIGFNTKKGVVVYKSKDPRMGLLTFVDSGDSRAVSVAGKALSAKSNALVGALDSKEKMVVLFPIDRTAGKVFAQALLQYYKNDKEQNVVAEVRTRLPAKGALVMAYERWSGKRPEGLKALVVRGKQASRVPVSFQ